MTLTNPLDIFISAEKARKAVITLHVAAEFNDPHNQRQVERWFDTNTPSIVLGALSLELHLKCLLAVQNDQNPPFGHDLIQLFDKLSAENQSAVQSIWDNAPLTERRFRAAVAERWNMPASLRNEIEVSKNAFVRYRYEFEGDGPGGFMASAVTESVRIRTMQLRPDFRLYALGPDQPHPNNSPHNQFSDT